MRQCRLGVLFAIGAAVAWSQGNLGGLTGVVLDPSSAPVPNAKLTLTNRASGLVLSTNSTEQGYSFRSVPPGDYRLEGEATGFKRFVVDRVPVLTATVATFDVRFEVGATSDSVVVAAEAIGLQTSSPEIGTVLQRGALLDLPIQLGNNTTAQSGRRQPENFIFLTPGVTGSSWEKNINGAPGFTQEVLIDGVSAQLASNPGFLAQTSPPYEAVEEFKLQNTLFPAEFGRGFGIINYTLRSGSNQFHGALFEFLRNDKLDARPFFAARRPTVRYNEFGGSIGGPVTIPKLYRGKDRTFFNFNYTGLRNVPPASSALVSVPTAEFRQGDFSRYVDSAGTQIPIFDPASTAEDGSRSPFPGARIPAARFSGVARRSLALLPGPDLPGYVNNYRSRQRNPISDNVRSIKIDHVLSPNQRLSGSYWGSRADQTLSSEFGAENQPYGVWAGVPFTGRNWRANYNWTARPNLIYFLGVGYTRSNPIRERDTRKGNEILQIPGIANDAPGFPTFSVGNPYGTLTYGNSTQQPNDPSINKSYVFTNNLTWIHGAHQVKFGGEFRWMGFDNFRGVDSGGIAGQFNFSALTTSNLGDPANANRFGNGWASFLLGAVNNAIRFVPAGERQYRARFGAFFVEDVFKVSRKVTLTAGLRYELPGTPKEMTQGWSTLDLNTPNQLAGNRLGALAFLSQGAGLAPMYKRAYSPRLGLAWQLDEKTVIRSGAGVFWAPTNLSDIGQTFSTFNYGFSFAQEFPQLTGGRVPVLNLDTGVPPVTVQLPNRNPTLMNGVSVDYLNAGANKPGVLSSWSLSVQRQLPWGILADAAYVGQRANSLPGNLENLNQLSPSLLRLGNTLNADINSALAQQAGVIAPFAGFRGSVGQALRAYPQYSGIRNAFQPTGWSTYNSMQLRVQKQYRGGTSFLLAYTRAKSLVSGSTYSGRGLDAAGGAPLDTANRILERRLASFDQPNVFVFNWTAGLPFGKGRKFAANANGFVDRLIGGWQFTMIHRYQSGTPIGIGGGGPIPLFGGGNRPNRVAGVDPLNSFPNGFDPARDRYLKAAAFAQPANFAFGTAAPNYGDIRTFPFLNEDAGILKSFRLTENHRLQFRAEFFNLFNRVVFGGPNGNTLAGAAFGQIGSQANTPRSIQMGLRYSF